MTIPIVTSRIDAVTIYRRGARVTRVASIQPVAAESPDRVRITGLPLCLDDSSINVRVNSNGNGSRIANDARVVLELPNRTEAPGSTSAPNLEEVRSARKEHARIEALLAQLSHEIGKLTGLKAAPRPRGRHGEPPIATPVDARLGMLELRSRRLEDLHTEAYRLRRELARARERRDDLVARLHRSSTDRELDPNELRKSVIISFSGQSQAELQLALDYVVPGAEWAPAYSFHIESERATLRLRALVSQRTGEDWTDAAVSVSTAEPATFAELPELSSLRIGRAQPAVKKRGFRPAPTDYVLLYADYDRVAKATPPEDIAPNTWAGAAAGGAAPSPTLTAQAAFAEEAMAPAPPPAAAMRQRVAPAPMAARASVMLGVAQERLQAPAPQHRSSPPADIYLINYNRLRMPAPAAQDRGTLIYLQRESYYRESLFMLSSDAGHSLWQALDQANRAARENAEQPLPPRYVSPRTADGFAYIYPSATRVDVPSDGQHHSIAVTNAEASLEQLYIVVPRESEHAFRVASLKNPLNAPLLPGPVDVYDGERYLLTADMPLTAPFGKFELGLGVEPALKVARNTSYAEQTAGLMGGSLSLRHELRLEAINHLSRKVTLEIRERLPVTPPESDDVKVELVEVEPRWESYDQEVPLLKGGYRWLISLEPGAKQQLKAVYAIRISGKHELVGGNRRD